MLERTGQQAIIDLDALRNAAGEQAAPKIHFLVDMAKAEALDHLGEQRAAIELVERHL